MRRQLILALLVVAGCAGSGRVSYHGSANVYATTPDLVYVSPGVQVIADYDEPVFYTDGFYWRYYGGTWYRSRVHTGGWVYASAPRALLTIERPHTYVRYRPRGYVSRRQTPSRPVYRDERPVIRDRRTPPAPAPVIRDHRTPPGYDRRDERHERRDERQDRREDRAEERQEHREDVKEDRAEERRDRRDDRRDDRQEDREDRDDRRDRRDNRR